MFVKRLNLFTCDVCGEEVLTDKFPNGYAVLLCGFTGHACRSCRDRHPHLRIKDVGSGDTGFRVLKSGDASRGPTEVMLKVPSGHP